MTPDEEDPSMVYMNDRKKTYVVVIISTSLLGKFCKPKIYLFPSHSGW